MTVVALSGGVGGAKLAVGLSRVLPEGSLHVVANTGDDFDHLGLRICPDIDTLMYALAGLDHPEQGWGRASETWSFMAALNTLGGPTWFKLGDADLATHVARTRRLAEGWSLSEVTSDFVRRLGIATKVLPMSNDDVRTQIRSSGAWIEFQDYFVRHRCSPVAEFLRYVGSETARPNPAVLQALQAPDLQAIVICPSNPFLSIGPILALPGLRVALRAAPVPVIAVSPIIGGQAVKGPTAKLMRELGMAVSASAVASAYSDLADIFIADASDADDRNGSFPSEMRVVFSSILMSTLGDREALARTVLDLADAWRGERV